MTHNEEKLIRLTGKPIECEYFGLKEDGFELLGDRLYLYHHGKLQDYSWYVCHEEYKTSVKYKQRLHTFESIIEAISILYSDLKDLRSIVENDINDD